MMETFVILDNETIQLLPTQRNTTSHLLGYFVLGPNLPTRDVALVT